MVFLICHAFYCVAFNHRKQPVAKCANGKIWECRDSGFHFSREAGKKGLSTDVQVGKNRVRKG